jgi:hypothetical protein
LCVENQNIISPACIAVIPPIVRWFLRPNLLQDYKPKQKVLSTDGLCECFQSLVVQANASITDADETVIPEDIRPVTFTIEGDGELVSQST